MKSLKRIINDFVYRLHVKNDLVLKIKQEELRREFHDENATIGFNTRIFSEARINNNLNDKTKIVIGSNCDIRGELLTFGHGGEISIGNYSFVGERTKIWSARRIEIGDRVLISHDVNIHDNNAHPMDSKLRHEDFKHISSIGLQRVNDLREKEIVIGDDVWIGFNSTIMKGVKIGNGAIIGANTIINKDVPDFAVCVGNPMRIVKYGS